MYEPGDTARRVASPQQRPGARLACAPRPRATGRGQRRRASVAAEEPVAYDADPAPTTPVALWEAVEALDAALDLLGRVDLDREADRSVRDAAVDLQRLVNRTVGQQVRVLDEVDVRAAYAHDGAVTTASWYRSRANIDNHEASGLAHAAVRSRRVPELRAALLDGEVTLSHGRAITSACIPQRAASVGEHEPTLVQLAKHAPPRDVKKAVAFIRDVVDPDGSQPDDHDSDDDASACDHTDEAGAFDRPPPDVRRFLKTVGTVDGLHEVHALLDPWTFELLMTLLEAFCQPDPADTPDQRKRSHGQRMHDALEALCEAAMAARLGPSVHGHRPLALLALDLSGLLGLDGPQPRLRHAGSITLDLARWVLHRASIQIVLTMGPWRVVNVGRRFRTLPAWLRTVLEMIHRHCRGPDCDRKFSWCDAAHLEGWAAGGLTDLNASLPFCDPHHDMADGDEWTVTYDPTTGVVTWTGREGHVITVPPPPRKNAPPLRLPSAG